MTWSWNFFVLAVRLLQLKEWYPHFSLLFNHIVQATDKQVHCKPEENGTLFRDRYSPDLTGAEERRYGKGMEADMDIKNAKSTFMTSTPKAGVSILLGDISGRGKEGRQGGKSSYTCLLLPLLILTCSSVYLQLILILLHCQWRSSISSCKSNPTLCLNTKQI